MGILVVRGCVHVCFHILTHRHLLLRWIYYQGSLPQHAAIVAMALTM